MTTQTAHNTVETLHFVKKISSLRFGGWADDLLLFQTLSILHTAAWSQQSRHVTLQAASNLQQNVWQSQICVNANWSSSVPTSRFCVGVDASHLLRGLLKHFGVLSNQAGNLESLQATPWYKHRTSNITYNTPHTYIKHISYLLTAELLGFKPSGMWHCCKWTHSSQHFSHPMTQHHIPEDLNLQN